MLSGCCIYTIQMSSEPSLSDVHTVLDCYGYTHAFLHYIASYICTLYVMYYVFTVVCFHKNYTCSHTGNTLEKY